MSKVKALLTVVWTPSVCSPTATCRQRSPKLFVTLAFPFLKPTHFPLVNDKNQLAGMEAAGVALSKDKFNCFLSLKV